MESKKKFIKKVNFWKLIIDWNAILKVVVVYYFLLTKYFRIEILDKLLISYLCEVSVTNIQDYDLRPGNLMVFTDKMVYKVQLFGNNLDKDVCNRKQVFKNSYPANQIDILQDNPRIISYALLEKKEVNFDDIVDLLLLLRKNGEVKGCIQNGFPKGIVNGLAVFDFYKINDKQKESIFVILNNICRKQIHMGIVHGDLHCDNVLYDENGKCFLIDFDCSREDDIQAFDAMYYIFEKERKTDNMNWLLFWKILWRKKDEIEKKYHLFFEKLIDLTYEDIMIILFIERLGQEYLLGEKYDSSIVVSVLVDIISYYEKG